MNKAKEGWDIGWEVGVCDVKDSGGGKIEPCLNNNKMYLRIIKHVNFINWYICLTQFL